MKNFCNKGKVQPSPAARTIGEHLSFLPATILTLAAALSPEDREVLAYLTSCCGNSNNTDDNFSGHNKATHKSSVDHAPLFRCNCFRCYMSFWVRWDKSPNRQVIHEIIEAYEEGLFREKRSLKRKKRGKRASDEFNNGDIINESAELDTVEARCDRVEEVGGGEEYGNNVEPEIKGSVSKIMSSLGEKFWGFFGVEIRLIFS